MTEQPLRAVIYTRISRDDSGEGVANDRQESDCRKLADLRGWTIVAVESDISVSASSGRSRPGWERVLGMVERGEVDLILAWHFDRMARSILDLEQLILLCEQHGVGASTVTGDIDLTTDTGQMVARILAAVARQEVQRKAQRQQAANRQRAAQGIPWSSGFRAFGYDLDGAVREDEADLIRRACEDALNGKSINSIAREWNAAGIHTARQRKTVQGWTHRSVKSVLLNPRNAGIATYRGNPIGKGTWSPIIDETTHTLLVAKLTDPSRKVGTSRAGRKPSNLLTGIATCGTCGDTVQAGSTAQGKVYLCPKYHVNTNREQADRWVRAAFASAVLLREPGSVYDARPASAPADLWTELEGLRERLDLLSTAYASGTIDLEQLTAGTAVLRGRQTELEEALAESNEVDESSAWAQRDDLAEAFRTGELEEQRAALQALATVVLQPKGRGNHRNKVHIRDQVFVQVRDREGNLSPAKPVDVDLDQEK